MSSDTPLVTVEQRFVLRLSSGEAAALLGALDHSRLAGSTAGRICDALAEATGLDRRGNEIAPVNPPRDPSIPQQDAAGADLLLRPFHRRPHSPVSDDSLLPRASAGQFIDDPLS